jgi:hypothetical protein
LDYRNPEDTVSVHEDLVIDSVEFFHIVKSAWQELRNSPEDNNLREKHINTLMKISFGDQFNKEEKMLCGKILCLIEYALNSTYLRSTNDKRNYNPKIYINSSQALWKENKELMTENLNLETELLKFICDAQFDSEEATKYLTQDSTKALYGVTELLNAQMEATPKDTKNLVSDLHCKSQVVKDIKEFRTLLVSMIRPTGDALCGYKIKRPQENLYAILNETRLYQHGKYTENRVRFFARYFFDRLATKSRDLMAYKLIMNDCENADKENPNKVEKKSGNKNKRKKRNRNKNKDHNDPK